MLQKGYLVAIVAVDTAKNERFNFVFVVSSYLILTERSHPRGEKCAHCTMPDPSSRYASQRARFSRQDLLRALLRR